MTGAVAWRRDGIWYKKNEVYLDIMETMNVLLNSKGEVLQSEVIGKMHMKVQDLALTMRPPRPGRRGVAEEW